jgi:DNA-binding response OmpR family regulator
MKNSLLVFGTKNFNNSFIEIKEYFDFSLIFFDLNNFSESSLHSIQFLIVDRDICDNADVLSLLNKINNKPLLLVQKSNSISVKNLVYDEKIILPLTFSDFTSQIINFIASNKFNKNSSIKINEYLIDKNKRLLKKGKISVNVTEREIQLIELLFNEQNPLSKSIILNQVWKYADDADTHTIETHIYRLKKKIFNKFNDANFIVSSKNGYTIQEKK